MTELHPESLSAYILRSSQGAFAAALGITIQELGPGRMVGRMDLEDHLLIEPGGLVHAGSVFGLADTCAGWGCLASLPDGIRGFATIEGNINLIATAGRGDTLLATAVMKHAPNDSSLERRDRAAERRAQRRPLPLHPDALDLDTSLASSRISTVSSKEASTSTLADVRQPVQVGQPVSHAEMVSCD
jgi:1,4-dihydroxy-2-naphthoyl-CoA hydrolase